jgi:AsmA protein
VSGGSRVRFDAAVDLGGVDLRPGGTVAKAPGDRLALTARGSARLPGGGAADVALDEVGLDLLGDRLTGRATASLSGAGASRAVRFDADARGDRLDLDRLLLPASPGAARPEEPAAPQDPTAFAGLAGTATLRLGTLRAGKQDVRDVVLKVVVQGDQVTLEQARLAAFGGTVKADGTKVALASEGQPVTVKLDLAGVAGRELLGLLSRLDLLDGRLDATVELSGRGLASKPLLQSLTGSLGGTVFGGLFKGADLVAGVTGPLAARLPFAARALEGRGATPLGKALPFKLAVADGRARLLAPLQLDTGRGALSLEGTVGLDGTLDLPATLALTPEAVSALTLGKVRLDAPLPIGFRVTGPAWKPRLEAIQLDGAVKALAAQAAAQALGKAGVDAAGLQQKAAGARAEAEAQAAAAQAAARARLEAEAARLAEEQKAAAEAARKKLEEEARKRLEGLFGR